MSTIIRSFALGCGLLVADCAASGGSATLRTARKVPQGKVLLHGDIASERMLDAASLAGMAFTEGEFTRRGEPNRFKGVPLWTLLREAGLNPGPEGKGVPKAQKRAGLRKIVSVAARDGLQTSFSAGELWDENKVTRCYVAWEIDGKPLPEAEGPRRLITPSDEKGIRSTYALESIQVIDPAGP